VKGDEKLRGDTGEGKPGEQLELRGVVTTFDPYVKVRSASSRVRDGGDAHRLEVDATSADGPDGEAPLEEDARVVLSSLLHEGQHLRQVVDRESVVEASAREKNAEAGDAVIDDGSERLVGHCGVDEDLADDAAHRHYAATRGRCWLWRHRGKVVLPGPLR